MVHMGTQYSDMDATDMWTSSNTTTTTTNTTTTTTTTTTTNNNNNTSQVQIGKEDYKR